MRKRTRRLMLVLAMPVLLVWTPLPSPATASVTVDSLPRAAQTAVAPPEQLRVMTYNILRIERDGTQAPGSEKVAPWSERRDRVARLIEQAQPDVVAVQEASDWVGPVRGPRQVDDLVDALGGDYSLAVTEIPPDQPHYHRAGRYILYRPTVYRPVGKGGVWDIGDQSWTAYQVFENRTTGARFLFVSTQLINGRGLTYDKKRLAETRTMIHKSRDYASTFGVKVVYAGDFNSHSGHHVDLDGPRRAMHHAHIRDAKDIAKSKRQARFDSGNLYMRRPPAFGNNVDHIYVPHGFRVRLWRELLRLRDGKFVGIIPSDHNPLVVDLRSG